MPEKKWICPICDGEHDPAEDCPEPETRVELLRRKAREKLLLEQIEQEERARRGRGSRRFRLFTEE